MKKKNYDDKKVKEICLKAHISNYDGVDIKKIDFKKI